jgi:hypothetical protein
VIEAAWWSHARRKFFVLADVAAKARGKLQVIAPLARAVRRIDRIFDIEREINGRPTVAWLADVLGRINDHSAHRLGELPPWNWRPLEVLARRSRAISAGPYFGQTETGPKTRGAYRRGTVLQYVREKFTRRACKRAAWSRPHYRQKFLNRVGTA